MKRKGIIWLAIIGFILYAGIIPFFIFSGIEDTLSSKASNLCSVKSLEKSQVQFNGRNGYLTVPSNIDKSTAQAAADDIEEIQGVRNVKIIYDDSIVADSINENEQTEASTEEIEASPGKFKLDWTPDEKTIAGELNEESTVNVEDIFGVAGLDISPDFALSDTVLDKLKTLGKGIFDDLIEGSLSVDGEDISLSGIVSENADIDDLKSKWGSISGIVLDITDITGPEVPDESEQAQTNADEIPEFDNIYFESGGIILKPKSEKTINEIADILLEHEDIDVNVIGHTDAQADAAWNMTLSNMRANAVIEMLVERGVDASRMTADGKGETEPIGNNNTVEGRQNNRRVEIIVRGNN